MRSSRKRLSVYFLTLLLTVPIIANFLIYSQVHAQQVAEDKGITVSPIKYEIEALPGETVEQEVKFFNTTKSEKTLYLDVVNFEPIGESGYPAPVYDDELPYESSLKMWVELEQTEITVQPVTPVENIATIVKFKINIPQNATPGGHYAMIKQSLKPPGQDVTQLEGSGLAFSPESAALVILNVVGEDTRVGQSEQFFATNPFLNESNRNPITMFETPPVLFVARIKNDGNSHFKPQGNIFLYRGSKQVATLPLNEVEGNVLGNSIRRFEEGPWGEDTFIYRTAKLDEDGNVVKDDKGNVQSRIKLNWSKLPNIPFGKYKAKLAAVYDDNGVKKTIEDEVTFWVIPWKLLLVVILLIVVIIGFFVYKRWSKRGTKKYQDG